MGIGYAEENSWFEEESTAIANITRNICANSIEHEENFVQALQEVLQVCGLRERHFEETRVNHFSGGERMRLSLACALFGHPMTVINSELASLDPLLRKEVLQNISTYAQRHGKIVFIKGCT